MVSPTAQQVHQTGFRNTNAFLIRGGKDAVLKYPVMAGYDAFLVDEENKTFYIKSNDINGQTISLREFKYEEVTPKEERPSNSSEYATKEDFNMLMAEIRKLQNNRDRYRNNRRNSNGKQYGKPI